VAEKGAKGPIFEGNMLPQKCTPKIGAITGILLISNGRFITLTAQKIMLGFLQIELHN
jgi:hypothetical protein